jgi:hypothetical protein
MHKGGKVRLCHIADGYELLSIATKYTGLEDKRLKQYLRDGNYKSTTIIGGYWSVKGSKVYFVKDFIDQQFNNYGNMTAG